jgi:hypothetical protein
MKVRSVWGTVVIPHSRAGKRRGRCPPACTNEPKPGDKEKTEFESNDASKIDDFAAAALDPVLDITAQGNVALVSKRYEHNHH